MKVFSGLLMIITLVSLLVKWRYRLLNMVLAVRVIRRIFVSTSMNIPSIRSNILQGLFMGNRNRME